jgi:DNA-directed RNA polymerase subunit omega
MINHPTIDRLIQQAQSPYACVIIAARRARQLNQQQQQDTNDMEYITPPLVQCASNNTLTIALEELANGKLVGDDPEAA